MRSFFCVMGGFALLMGCAQGVNDEPPALSGGGLSGLGTGTTGGGTEVGDSESDTTTSTTSDGETSGEDSTSSTSTSTTSATTSTSTTSSGGGQTTGSTSGEEDTSSGGQMNDPQPDQGLYSDCSQGQSCVGTDGCFELQDQNMVKVDGFCSLLCDTAADCVLDLDWGAEPTCLDNGACALACLLTSDCPVGMTCEKVEGGESYCW